MFRNLSTSDEQHLMHWCMHCADGEMYADMVTYIEQLDAKDMEFIRSVGWNYVRQMVLQNRDERNTDPTPDTRAF